MTTTYKFKSINTTPKFFHFNSSKDYSKILDDIIATDIIDKNKYLFNHDGTRYTFNMALKDDESDFIKASKFLANYKKKIPSNIIYGKMYKLSDGTPIVFYDDEIQIGFDTYSYSDFDDLSFLNGLTSKTKKIIIKIYGDANININLH